MGVIARNKVLYGAQVDDVIEITKENYDKLTPEERVDKTYFITDWDGASSGGGSGSSGINYSTDEQIIGTWLDKRPLYQKTIKLTTPSTTGDIEVALSDYDVTFDKIVDCEALSSKGDVVYKAPWSTQFLVSFGGNTMYLSLGHVVFTSADVYVTIRYVK